MTVLYTNIRELVTNDPANGDGDPLGIITDAALVVDGAKIAWIGRRAEAPDADDRISCADTSVIPGFVDSHTHLVFAGERSAEFAARMSGQPYGAGGIASTVAATRAADDATLLARVQLLTDELFRAGVTTFECKSGYGLTVEDEVRSLRIAEAVTDETTFLGAHVVPAEFRDDREAYIEMVSGPMLQACAPHARWVDVFCDRGAFDVDEARHILSSRNGRRSRCRGCTPANSGPARASGSRSSWALRRWITAPMPPTTTSRRSPARPTPPSPRCCQAPNSPRARGIRMANGSSTRARPSRWRPTAIPAVRSRQACRSASPSRCGT